jgi:hypothetical protein
MSDNDSDCVIRRGQIYTTKQIVKALGVARETIIKWKQAGLKPAKKGTKTELFLGDHIIKFLFDE